MPSTTVLLVDWPSQEVPRALLASALTVLSANFAAGTASSYSLGAPDEGSAEVLTPEHAGDAPLLITRLDAMPAHVDAVALFRPPEEHAHIAQRAIALGASAIWVQRGTLADDARHIARDAGLEIIEDVPVADAVQRLAALR